MSCYFPCWLFIYFLSVIFLFVQSVTLIQGNPFGVCRISFIQVHNKAKGMVIREAMCLSVMMIIKYNQPMRLPLPVGGHLVVLSYFSQINFYWSLNHFWRSCNNNGVNAQKSFVPVKISESPKEANIKSLLRAEDSRAKF